MYDNIGSFMSVFGKIVIVVGVLVALIIAVASGGEGEGILISIAVLIASVLIGAGFYAVSYTIALLEKNNEYLKIIMENTVGREQRTPNEESSAGEYANTESFDISEEPIVQLGPTSKKVVIKKNRQ